ncbi:MAG: DUF1624 domain-containing protein [Planctomycetaceae bacterium]|nr:DUF1624 domain-containing protein [Planctomycetaceae bacterium]
MGASLSPAADASDPSVSDLERTPSLPGFGRLTSIDALRGFDMIWIIGAAPIVKAIDAAHPGPTTTRLVEQLKHVDWEGFRFNDLIFPLFLVLVGVSVVLSLDKQLDRVGLWRTVARIVRRSLLLFLLGVLYYGGLTKTWPEVNLGGVLHRIAACYLFAALIYCAVCSARGLLLISAVLLAGYWAALTYVPFPDLTLTEENVAAIAERISSNDPAEISAAVESRIAGVYEEGRNLTNYIDFRYLPGKKAQRYYINEGLLSTIPAIALTLFGCILGRQLRRPDDGAGRRIFSMVIFGVLLTAGGILWGESFPIIKRIWTSSFVMLAGGLSVLLIALFHLIVDVWGLSLWCRPFVWVGANAITMYLAAKVISFSTLAKYFVGGDVAIWLDGRFGVGAAEIAAAVVGLLLIILLARLLYRHGVFIRV